MQYDTVTGHMLLAGATEGTHLAEPPATASKAEVSDDGFSPPTIVKIMEEDRGVHQEPKNGVEPSVMAAVVQKFQSLLPRD